MIYCLLLIPIKFNSPKSTPIILTFGSYPLLVWHICMVSCPAPSSVPPGSLHRGVSQVVKRGGSGPSKTWPRLLTGVHIPYHHVVGQLPGVDNISDTRGLFLTPHGTPGQQPNHPKSCQIRGGSQGETHLLLPRAREASATARAGPSSGWRAPNRVFCGEGPTDSCPRKCPVGGLWTQRRLWRLRSWFT